MRVLFLDIDGVLNSGPFLRSEWLHRKPETEAEWDVRQIDPAAVVRLNRIISETVAEIVISSTWRLMHTLPALKAILSKAGFLYSEQIIGVTPDQPRRERGDEIATWIRSRPGKVERFAILDDDAIRAALAKYLPTLSPRVAMPATDPVISSVPRGKRGPKPKAGR